MCCVSVGCGGGGCGEGGLQDTSQDAARLTQCTGSVIERASVWPLARGCGRASSPPAQWLLGSLVAWFSHWSLPQWTLPPPE